MVQSSATTVAEYLRTLPSERRAVVSEVRRVIRRHLPAGYVERMASGMISYEIPLARYPDTYNGRRSVTWAWQRRGITMRCT